MSESRQPYGIGFEESFERRLKQFHRKHPKLEEAFLNLLIELAADPFQPKLRIHALSGKLKGLHAVSFTRKMRVTLYLVVEQRRIRLVGIGDHDDVYR